MYLGSGAEAEEVGVPGNRARPADGLQGGSVPVRAGGERPRGPADRTPVCAGWAGLCSTDSETHFFSLPITEVEMFHCRWRVTM